MKKAVYWRLSARLILDLLYVHFPKNTRMQGRSSHGQARQHLTLLETSRRKESSHFLTDIILRFVIGGLFVTAFAVIGDLLKPKTFAGLFGAAPSVALATLALTIAKDGKHFAALEARSMLAGAAALCLYSLAVSRLTTRWHWPALRATVSALVVWFGTAFGLWWMWVR